MRRELHMSRRISLWLILASKNLSDSLCILRDCLRKALKNRDFRKQQAFQPAEHGVKDKKASSVIIYSNSNLSVHYHIQTAQVAE